MTDLIADVCIIGGGVAGLSAAYALSAERRVVVVETEDHVGRHASGRSAALLMETYGGLHARRLASASAPFFKAPPNGFCDHPLLRARGHLAVASRARRPALHAQATQMADVSDRFSLITSEEARRICPILRPDQVDLALWEPGCADIDVDGLMQGFLRGARTRGADICLGAPVRALARRGGAWEVDAGAVRVTAGAVVNAAGAWADHVAALAGIAPLGLSPLRRTAILVDAPPGHDIAGWPFVVDVDETIYFKPDAGKLLVSPADESPSDPCDAHPEEYDVAVAVDRLETLAEISVRRVPHRWAGLRTFSPDRAPVIGSDPGDPTFVWLAALGGFGVQSAPAAGAAAAAALGVSPRAIDLNGMPADLGPARLRAA